MRTIDWARFHQGRGGQVGRTLAAWAVMMTGACGDDGTATTDSATGSTTGGDTTTTTMGSTGAPTTGTTDAPTTTSGVSDSDSTTSTTTTDTTTGTTTTDTTTTGTTTGTTTDTTGTSTTDTSTGGPVCGDGNVDPGEVCDDGVNDGSYGGCMADCSALGPYCGDGEQNGPESCDDGNAVDDDACSNACAVASCGDGVVQAPEECDDANAEDTDACLNTCVAASCGDGHVNAGKEACDDGNAVETDDCLSTCVAASCGDGFIQAGVEACDDGVNDGAYDGCAVGCAALGPHCGDGVKNGVEECDDADADLADGCLDNCTVPESCLVLKNYDPALQDGDYFIGPGNLTPFEVWCDMVTDGGGYTFLKIDPAAQYDAAQAEARCDTYAMNLFIPRTQAHQLSAWSIANNAGIGPDASADYLRILGIYPQFNGATCANQGMNSGNANCGWRASDNGPWWVHNVNNISEPNGDNSTVGSMYYQWQANGTIQWHNDIGGAGYTSSRFMCDVGDKK